MIYSEGVTALPMFPLGTVLLPGTPLSLQIFEPRYQRLLSDVLARDATFGVVLIARGHEVGGGDIRHDIGTTAQIAQHVELGGGRHGIVALGGDRFRVREWLPDDPYPRAIIDRWPDVDAATSDDATVETMDLISQYWSRIEELRHLFSSAQARGYQGLPVSFEAPDDPVAGSYFLAGLLPIGPFDRQQLLESPSTTDRLERLGTMIKDQIVILDRGPDRN